MARKIRCAGRGKKKRGRGGLEEAEKRNRGVETVKVKEQYRWRGIEVKCM